MENFFNRIQAFDKRSAIIYNDLTFNYSDLARQIQAYSDYLAGKVAVGEIVFLYSSYNFFSIALFLALIKNKNIVVPVVPDFSNKEIEKKRSKLKPNKIISLDNQKIIFENCNIDGKRKNQIKLLQKKDHPGLILFSSGTTGEPKIILHDLDELISSYSSNKIKDINSLLFLAFDHIGGIDTLFRLLSIGGTLTIPEDSNAENICRLIEKHRVNVLPASPTFLNLILIGELHEKYDLSSLKIIGYGAESMPEYVLQRLNNVFPGVDIQQKFGTSETNAVKILSRSAKSTDFKIIDPNVDYKIIDGELWLKSKNQIKEYLNFASDNFTPDGWFKTGDIVEKFSDGYIRIKGRKKEVINVGGEKVLPLEVENILLEIPEIKECIVYPEDNPITGQMVVADVILNKILTKAEIKNIIRNYCKDKLRKFKIPVKVNIVEQILHGKRIKKKRLDH